MTVPLVVGIVLLSGLFAPADRAYAATVVVSPTDMHGWSFYTWGTGIGEFATGPGITPSGVGSAHLSRGASSATAEFHKSGYNGVHLGQITNLSYYAYEPVIDAGTNPLALRLIVSTEFGVDALAFWPGPQNPGVAPNVWQQWNTMNGHWRSTLFGNEQPEFLFAGGTIAEYLTFLAVQMHSTVEPYIIDDYPFASASGIRFVKNGNAGEEAYVDDVTIGVSGADTTYDFEPDGSTTPTDTPTPTYTSTATPTATPTPTPTYTATATATNTPPAPSVGGIAEQPDLAALRSAARSGHGYAARGRGVVVLIAIAGIVVVGWYVRRKRAA